MSQQTVYAIASGKGGVGKTTTTVNLGTALAAAGRRVVVVDADIGMANLAGLVSLSDATTTLHDVLAGDATVDDALYRLADGISAIPSGTDLVAYADAETEGLTDVVGRLRERFDVVLLDVGAGISHETVLPLGLSDGVVLVSTPDPASVQDVHKTIELTDRADGTVVGLVMTRVREDGDVDPETIAGELDVDLLGTIPEDDAVRSSIHDGTPVVVYAPDSPAAKGYKRLAKRLIDGETVSSETATDDPPGGEERTNESETRAASENDVSDAITNVDERS